MDHHDRCGGDLRGGGGQASSGLKDPSGNETSDQSRSELATGWDAQSCRIADVSDHLSGVLHRNDFGMGRLRLLRQ